MLVLKDVLYQVQTEYFWGSGRAPARQVPYRH